MVKKIYILLVSVRLNFCICEIPYFSSFFLTQQSNAGPWPPEVFVSTLLVERLRTPISEVEQRVTSCHIIDRTHCCISFLFLRTRFPKVLIAVEQAPPYICIVNYQYLYFLKSASPDKIFFAKPDLPSEVVYSVVAVCNSFA